MIWEIIKIYWRIWIAIKNSKKWQMNYKGLVANLISPSGFNFNFLIQKLKETIQSGSLRINLSLKDTRKKLLKKKNQLRERKQWLLMVMRKRQNTKSNLKWMSPKLKHQNDTQRYKNQPRQLRNKNPKKLTPLKRKRNKNYNLKNKKNMKSLNPLKI